MTVSSLTILNMLKSPYPHFSESEFQRCTPKCSSLDMSAAFMERLERFRETVAQPIYLNSAFRSMSWEATHNRSGSSMHTRGRAVDIQCRSNQERLKFVRAAIACGFNGIGIGRNYIHLDDRADCSNPCMWLY